MSLIQTVVKMVEERGLATVDDIYPLIPERTRQQVQRAFHNAVALGLIQAVEHRHQHKFGGSRLPSIYAPGRRSNTSIRPVSSVFHLGGIP